MDGTSGDKNYIENLFKAMPVNEAINSFTEIDNRILELLKCSSDDFLSLNDQFKNYHKESKQISQNANSIIEILINSKANKSFENLKNYSDEFNNIASGFAKHIETIDVEIKKTTNTIENLKIAHNNYKQDLSSVRLLIAGLGQDNGNAIFTPNEVSQIANLVENIKNQFAASEESIQDYISSATENCLFLTNIKKENNQQLHEIKENIDVSISLFEKKYTEAADVIPTIKTLNEKSTSNIAAIITNLQYHDIIRQKIEHIQRTHKDIMSELIMYESSEQSTSLIHNKAKTFLKMRDVAGLQAAQLLHANKQYQIAIEEIGKNLECIGNDMITISSVCDSLVGKSEQTKNTYFYDIVQNLNHALNYTSNLSALLTEILNRVQNMSVKEAKIASKITEIKKFKEEIKAITNKYPKTESLKNENNINALSQLSQFINDTDKLESHIAEIHSRLNFNLNNLKEPFWAINLENNIGPVEKFSNFIPEFNKKLTSDTEKIDGYIYMNSTISHKISDSITNSLNCIRYYELFENSCERIIEELNTINVKLNYGESANNHNRLENLKLLKARYTMASEHIIHEQVTRLHGNINITEESAEKIIDLADQNSDDDDDNLELF